MIADRICPLTRSRELFDKVRLKRRMSVWHNIRSIQLSHQTYYGQRRLFNDCWKPVGIATGSRARRLARRRMFTKCRQQSPVSVASLLPSATRFTIPKDTIEQHFTRDTAGASFTDWNAVSSVFWGLACLDHRLILRATLQFYCTYYCFASVNKMTVLHDITSSWRPSLQEPHNKKYSSQLNWTCIDWGFTIARQF